MRAKAILNETNRREPTLQEEIAVLGDDDLMDFMNLTQEETGIAGTLFLTTAMGAHGPGVKYYVKTGPGQQSFSVSIEEKPRLVATSLPERVTGRMAPEVIAWVKLNHAALLKFWNDGQFWTRAEVNAFVDTLQKLPG